MNRRSALKSMAAVTAAVRLPAAAFPAQAPSGQAAESDEAAALPLSLAEEAAEPTAGFFSAQEMAAFRRLAEAMAPQTRTPGAEQAGAPEFLDSYLDQSGPERQNLYRQGLARLDDEARRRFGRVFAELTGSQIDAVLGPLRQPWAPEPSADTLEAFLRAAKDDLWRATVNSRPWALATEGRRRSGGGGPYWYPIE